MQCLPHVCCTCIGRVQWHWKAYLLRHFTDLRNKSDRVRKKYMLKAVIQMDNFFVLSSRFFVCITFYVLFKVMDFVKKKSFDLSMLRIPINCTAGIE